jgi:hypothetical protein
MIMGIGWVRDDAELADMMQAEGGAEAAEGAEGGEGNRPGAAAPAAEGGGADRRGGRGGARPKDKDGKFNRGVQKPPAFNYGQSDMVGAFSGSVSNNPFFAGQANEPRQKPGPGAGKGGRGGAGAAGGGGRGAGGGTRVVERPERKGDMSYTSTLRR